MQEQYTAFHGQLGGLSKGLKGSLVEWLWLPGLEVSAVRHAHQLFGSLFNWMDDMISPETLQSV